MAVNGSVSPSTQRRNHESCTKTRWRSVSTIDHSSSTPWCSLPAGSDRTRSVVVAQSSCSCRQASRRSSGWSERISSRTG